jgi:uncharacterized membrane protein YfcA
MTSALLGILVGLVLGLTGAGGSILASPLLIAGLGWSLPQTEPVALLAVCAAATFGTIVAWDVTYVRYRAATLIAVAGFFTAPLGVKAAWVLPVPTLTLLFAGVMVLVGGRMALQAWRAPAEAGIVRATVAGDTLHAQGRNWIALNERGRVIWNAHTFATLATIGAMTGFIAGLLGVGGGFVIVPSLRYTSRLSMHSVVATSLLAIALTSAGAVIATLAQGYAIPWHVTLPFVAGSLAGMLAGRKLAPRIAGPRLQQAFAALMLAVAAGLFIHVAAGH